ncbi:MAG: anthranilate synthase component I [Spirochaetaceae bacterium]|nr:anthranilate synthase component I [Spirochaetaceae bacterium]|tara:strand:+ start:17358 stop:18920 length:1563 start_codon:yes stop_codon:yes gene_type:complete
MSQSANRTERPAAGGLPRWDLPLKPVYKKIHHTLDFFGLFRIVERHSHTCFFLESLEEGSSDSRYSVIGFLPEVVLRAQSHGLHYEKLNTAPDSDYSVLESDFYESANPYELVANWMPDNSISRNYCGGLVGYLGYDATNFFEPGLGLRFHPEFDPFVFGIYTDGLVYDKMTGEVFYFYYDKDRSAQIQSWMEEKPPATEPLKATLLEKTRSAEQHRVMVQQTLEEIKAGNTFQCQIGFQVNYKLEGSTMAFYEALREVNPSPYMYFVKFGQRQIIGASPELVFRLRQGEMETYPLAGTTRRAQDKQEDITNARSLLNDPKEIAEHNMLVDLHRNDLGRVARFGTVKVRRLMDIRKFSHVQHISSEVVGIIRKDKNMFDGLKATFPAGTLSGAPKVESMKIIERIEKSPRGPYGGAVGHFGWNGDCTFAIPIRTLFVNGNHAFARASGGIVYDSDPDYEFREIENKLAAIVRTLERFETGGTGKHSSGGDHGSGADSQDSASGSQDSVSGPHSKSSGGEP